MAKKVFTGDTRGGVAKGQRVKSDPKTNDQGSASRSHSLEVNSRGNTIANAETCEKKISMVPSSSSGGVDFHFMQSAEAPPTASSPDQDLVPKSESASPHSPLPNNNKSAMSMMQLALKTPRTI